MQFSRTTRSVPALGDKDLAKASLTPRTNVISTVSCSGSNRSVTQRTKEKTETQQKPKQEKEPLKCDVRSAQAMFKSSEQEFVDQNATHAKKKMCARNENMPNQEGSVQSNTLVLENGIECLITSNWCQL